MATTTAMMAKGNEEEQELKLSEILHGVLHTITASHKSLWRLCTSDPLFIESEENRKKALFYFFRDTRKLLVFAFILTKWANFNIERSRSFSILNNPSDKMKDCQIDDVLRALKPFSHDVFPRSTLSLLSNSDFNFAIDFLAAPSIRVLNDNLVPPEKRMRLTQEDVDDVVGFVERTIQWRLFCGTKFPSDTYSKISLEHGILTLVVDGEYRLSLTVTGPSVEKDKWVLRGFNYVIPGYTGIPSDAEWTEVCNIFTKDPKDSDVFINAHKKISTHTPYSFFFFFLHAHTHTLVSTHTSTNFKNFIS